VNSPRQNDHPANSAGVTLVEIVIAMTVFMVLALGLTTTVIQSQEMAQNNIIRNTAYTVAQGYIEQIKSIPVQTINQAISSPTGVSIPTKSVSALNTGSIELEDPLFLNGPDASLSGQSDGSNHKEIMIDLKEKDEGESEEVVMDCWFDLDIDPLDLGTRTFSLPMRFEAALRNRNGARTSGVLRAVRTDVNRLADD